MEFVPSKTNSIKKQRKELQIRGPAGTLPLCTSTPPPMGKTVRLYRTFQLVKAVPEHTATAPTSIGCQYPLRRL